MKKDDFYKRNDFKRMLFLTAFLFWFLLIAYMGWAHAVTHTEDISNLQAWAVSDGETEVAIELWGDGGSNGIYSGGNEAPEDARITHISKLAPNASITFNANMPQNNTAMNAAIPASTTIRPGQQFGAKLDWRDPTMKTGYFGHTFSGWNTRADGTGIAVDASFVSTFTTATTLYAQWNPIRMTLSFDANGGHWTTAPDSSYTVTYGLTYSSQVSWNWTLPSRTGYLFAGWNTKADGSGYFYGPHSLVGVVSDHTLYVQWVAEDHLDTSIMLCYNEVRQLCGPSHYTGYLWSPAGGLSDTDRQCVTLSYAQMPSDSVTYTCRYALGQISNWDFFMGNVGFSSSYNIVEDIPEKFNELWPERTLAATTCWHNVHPNLDAECELESYEGDKASGGKFLAINGGSEADAIVWEQTVPVSRNINYALSIQCAAAGETNPARLLFFINNVQVSASEFVVTEYTWTKMSATWYSGENDYATIVLKNNATEANGNDFAIDHFVFEAVDPYDDFEVVVKRLPPFTPGSIDGTGETIAVGSTASTIGNMADAAGGDGDISYQWYVNGVAIAGATSATYTPTHPYTTTVGTYQFTRGTKDGKCNTTFTPSDNSWNLTVESLTFELNEITVSDHAICLGESTSMTVSPVGTPEGTVVYQWSPSTGLSSTSASSVTATPTSTSTQTYTVTATLTTATYTLTASKTATITVYPLPTVSVTPPSDCPNQTAYTLTAIPTGGTAPYTYQWSNGADGTAATSIIAKVDAADCGHVYPYTLLLTDRNGCSATATGSFSLTDSVSPTLTLVSDEVTLTSSNCIYVVPNLTTNTYVSSATDNCGIPILTQSIAAGTEISTDTTVAIILTDGCGNSVSKNVTLKIPTPLILTLTTTQESCDGHDAKIAGLLNGGTPPYKYSWSNGVEGMGYGFSHLDTLTSTGTAAGYYSLTVTDAHQCTVSQSATVTLNNPLRLNDISIPPFCSGYEFSYTPQNGVDGNVLPSNITYSWPAVITPEGVTGPDAANGQEHIKGTFTNTTGAPVNVSMFVTPEWGICLGTTNTTSITVYSSINPSVSIIGFPEDMTRCRNAENVTINANYTHVNSLHTDTWFVNNIQQQQKVDRGMSEVADSYTFDIPNVTCDTDYLIRLEYEDASHCMASDEVYVHISVPMWVLPGDGSATVNCSEEAVAPHTLLPSLMPAHVVDGCGEILEPVLQDSLVVPDPLSCGGQIVYTYRYTACDNSYRDWTFIYDIVDGIPPTFTRPADITIYRAVNGPYDASTAIAGEPTNVNDNCSAPVAVAYSDTYDETTEDLIIKRVWRVVDACGNRSTDDSVQILTVKAALAREIGLTRSGREADCLTLEPNDKFIDQNGRIVNGPRLARSGRIIRDCDCDVLITVNAATASQIMLEAYVEPFYPSINSIVKAYTDEACTSAAIDGTVSINERTIVSTISGLSPHTTYYVKVEASDGTYNVVSKVRAATR